MQITAAQLCELLKGRLIGDPQQEISNIAKIEEAKKTDVSFIANPKYLKYATTTEAGVLIVARSFKATEEVRATLIVVEDPYASFTEVLSYVEQSAIPEKGIDPSAYVSPSAVVGRDVYIGPFAYVGHSAELKANARLYPHAYLGDNATVGENTIIYSGVKIYHHCKVGARCILHAGAVIGSDGFGFAPQPNGTFKKIPQTGNVIIENEVEVGANTTIDRGTLGSTIIRNGVKLDNLIQIAHNVDIGENTVIASQTGISGSTQIGKNCMIGGQAGFVGHISVADGSKINAKSGVSKTIATPQQAWTGTPVAPFRESLRWYAHTKQLPDLVKRLNDLEKKLDDLLQ